MTRLRPNRQLQDPSVGFLWLLALLCLLAAGGWLWLRSEQPAGALPPARLVDALPPGVVARMDSPVFSYTPGWHATPAGADPTEPPHPWREPSGRVEFAYRGQELALNLAVGNYWGYLYVTVDGNPANRLAVIPGNRDSEGRLAGYKPLLAPEHQTPDGPTPQWTVVHRAQDDGPHQVEVEVWRSWGQTPLRAVAVDGLSPPPLPLWPGVALALAAGWLFFLAAGSKLRTVAYALAQLVTHLTPAPLLSGALQTPDRLALLAACLGIGGVAGGVLGHSWLLTDVGLAVLAVAGLLRLELWTGALLFGLPFYLYPLPILPNRALNLIEIGVWGGLVLLTLGWSWQAAGGRQRNPQSPITQSPNHPITLLLLLSLALVAAFAAQERGVALREWRTLFLAAAGFALLFQGTLLLARERDQAQARLILAWLAGGAVVASVGLWQYRTGQMIIQAEGVNRVRGLYGSPNNLALYLERTVAVGIGCWVLGVGDWGLGTGRRETVSRPPLPHLVFAALLLPQVAALVLTFSKGALFLAAPTMLVTLAGLGALHLRRRQASLRPLWGIAAVALAIGIGLAPFLNADRFRLLFDVGQGTTGGLRLNLWRSSLAMALDHPGLGVGPDNFLYAYRSGYILPGAWQDPDLNHPHNLVLDWWTRLGVGGLLLAGIWLTGGMRRLWRWLGRGPTGEKRVDRGALAVGCLAAIGAALAHGLIDASYALPDLMLVWVLLLSVGDSTGDSAGDVHNTLGQDGTVELPREDLPDHTVPIDEEGGG